jgi:serine/threonine-protein kinase
MAPEQAAGRKEQDHRIDIYAVGVILYEMLTGQLPYQGDNYNALIAAILTEEPLRPTAQNPGIPMEVENIIVTAMSKQPHNRYPNALNLMEALKPFAPNWALRPSKTPGLLSTMSYGQTVAAPTPTPIADSQISYSQPVARTPSQMGISNTSDLSLAGVDSGKSGSKKVFIILGVVAVLLLMIGGGLAVGFGTGLIGRGNDSAAVDPKVGSEADKPKKEVEPLVEEKPVDTRVDFEILGAPEGATIFLGGEALEGNPAKVEPSEEERELRIEAAGFEPWVEKMVIDRTMTIRLSSMVEEGDKKSGKKKKKSSDKPVYVVEKEEAPPPKIEVSKTETPKKDGKKKGGKKESSVYGGKETGIDDSIY